MKNIKNSPSNEALLRLAIAVPTYNEAKNIEKLILSIKSVIIKLNIACTLLIIDDNSPDGTGVLVEKLAKTQQTNLFKIDVLSRKNKEGLGKAYIAGISYLLKTDHTHILQMDADFSHNPKYITSFIKATNDADFVIGSRYIKDGETPDWGWFRKVQSRAGNYYAQLFLGHDIHDYTGGYNLYSRELLEAIDLKSIEASGYGFLIELKQKAKQHSKGIHEIPDRVYRPASRTVENT